MYAIVTTGSKQYKVAKGDVIDVEKLDAKEGDTVELDVLLCGGEKTVADPAKLKGKKAKAKVLRNFRGKKVTVFKFHKRKRYQRTRGHRQSMTALEIIALPEV